MEYGMDFEEAKAWYDGYGLITHKQDRDICYSMYSPKSVVEAMLRHKSELIGIRQKLMRR